MAFGFRRTVRRFLFAALFFIPLHANASGDPIVIGQAIDLSSPNADIGRDYVAGIKTYFDALNAAGGIGGRPVRYITRDDQGRSEVAAKEVSELIERDRIDYLIGGVGEASMQAIINAPAFGRSNLTLFAPLAAANGQPSPRVLFWRPSYQQEIRYLLAHFDRLGAKTIGIAYQESPTNREAYNGLLAVIRERGIAVTGTARLAGDGRPNEMEIKRLAGSKPGFVMVIADTIATGLFLKEFRKYESQTFVASTSLINLATLREVAGPKAIEWTVFSQVVPNPAGTGSMIQSEHLKMMRKFRDESVSSLTLEGFAVAKGLAKAIELARPGSRNALQDLMARKGEVDLGGLYLVSSASTGHLSPYLDIALFRKATGLLF
ncbi:MAG TPA: ABC transporter substrate-binding protein [Noviherbaspirillum sp.]|jgi:ABC-type branched-subunit amino acid transport system substrate-binding protein|uniref:ABC transporter substrate-binding protein n=1 Tax=Noviherbaspirillum sp. TaxID=1926288 RepID=UPI002DDCC14D|nr:ABC transporter substrate-binding protein [Noviherbaspirillum sp.]HEV2610401.1 ABC transporter substrate-binding protein [Noviherbaspirillum sp.]